MSSTAGGDGGALGYVPAFLAARRQGLGSDHIHLGYWNRPPVAPPTPRDWIEAQDRLTERLLDMAALADGLAIADVACGIGGTLRAILARCRSARLVGVNIDAEQLAHCPGADEGVTLVRADACALPLASASLDRIVCIEAAFHFADRRRYLGAAARCLRAGGLLVHADILIDREAVPARLRAPVEAVLGRDFGPWPAPWTTPGMLHSFLGTAGFRLLETEDATVATLPSYSVVAPLPRPARPVAEWPGTQVLRLLHERGALRYHLLSARRTPHRWAGT